MKSTWFNIFARNMLCSLLTWFFIKSEYVFHRDDTFPLGNKSVPQHTILDLILHLPYPTGWLRAQGTDRCQPSLKWGDFKTYFRDDGGQTTRDFTDTSLWKMHNRTEVEMSFVDHISLPEAPKHTFLNCFDFANAFALMKLPWNVQL